jgi:hypothetical protein
MIAGSHSSSELLGELLDGPVRKGEVLQPRSLRFGGYVVSITQPGAPRMPNGIECPLSLPDGCRVTIGIGRLTIGELEVMPGPDWNPVPASIHVHRQPAGPQPLISGLTPWIAAPSPAGDELLAGYVAGLVLLHRRRLRATRIADRTADQMKPFGATILRHAARGEVPEPIHDLLQTGDPALLLEWAPSGMWWLRGLVSAGLLLSSTDVSSSSRHHRTGIDAEAI